ncbi:4-hydroxy-tetrahydrodipicolinate reductase [Vagococcus elongatus]|uniref:4-hydroxy-tetrahydrodipicolinate reductase n=1 Tax=Vagococcus elongatus TaxID=180344 RepID=A0A430AQA4_9ENTE|nr:4-hydroxy-tetrahydrodipicolinate reductase [Vagococcus elongatus]RSU10311.1 4-hydroxy-tetrahydrodipicolinate reductase [Vagococcus elongatus]
MEIGVVGNGQMGMTLEEVIKDTSYQMVKMWDVFPQDETITADVLIDFSNPANLTNILAYGVKNNIPVVIATTGYSNQELELIEKTAEKIPVLFSGNYSLGVIVMNQVVKQLAESLGETFDIEIIEKHHNKKLDAPSGTAKMLLDSVMETGEFTPVYGREGIAPRQAREVGVHALRGGTIVGEHEVIFAGTDELLSIKHEAFSKKIFAKGALVGAEWLMKQGPGLYSMEDCLF